MKLRPHRVSTTWGAGTWTGAPTPTGCGHEPNATPARLLVQCRTQLAQLYPRTGERDQGPQGVIWAGDAYGNHGTLLTDSQLRTLAQRRAAADAA